MRQSLASLVTVSFLAVGCSSPPKVEPPQVRKYSCLELPSSAYQAGTIIRTVQGTAAEANVQVDDLTVAYLPARPATSPGGVADIQQTVASGISASITGQKFAKYGISLNLSANATYSIEVAAKSNTLYVVDDNNQSETIKAIEQRNGILPNSRYFFVKESIGSQDILYTAKTKVGIEGKAALSAGSSELSSNINIRDGSNTVSSKRELTACVVMEEIKIGIVRGADGTNFSVVTDRLLVDDATFSNIPAIRKVVNSSK